MAANTFSTANETYRQLAAGGNSFRIPRFQRDYSWKEEHWEDLWLDILELLEAEDNPSHYMGYLVLQPREEQKMDVIDGQQRLTTLSIVVLSVMRKLDELVKAGIDPEHNRTRLDEIRRTYIGQLDPVSLNVSSKLILNRNNDHYFQTYLTTLREMPTRGFKTSEHAMRKSTDWFGKKISDYVRSLDRPEAESGETLARLVETLSRGLFFTVITVDDDLNAYKVFETLNARGVKLSAPDLLKNYLLSLISSETGEAHDEELDRVEQRWSDILERLQSENITSYLRTYWGANEGFVRQTELFKIIKRSVGSREQAYELIRGLEDGLETYLALTHPDQSGWTGEDKENAKYLKMFSVRQPFALLMAMRDRIPDGFSQVLSGIVNISFRYNVISSLQAAEQERTYSRVAIGISSGALSNANQVLNALRPIYPTDEVFRSSFASKNLDTSSSRNKQIVRYILAKIDAQSSGDPFVFPGVETTIEHILPENPHDNWGQFTDMEAGANVYRLGNMALLEEDLNREAGNNSYEVKIPLLQRSSIPTTTSIPERYEDWTEDTVSQRQNAQARLATGIWRVAQLT